MLTTSFYHTNAVEAPLLISNSMSPTGEIFPNHTTWTIQFDKQVAMYIIVQEGVGS